MFRSCLQPVVRAVTYEVRTVRYIRNKHRDPKWRYLRSQKVFKLELPDYDKIRREVQGKLSPDEIRAEHKKEGIAPTRPYNERPILVTGTDSVFEPYVPPEGDGRLSTLTKEGAKQRLESVEKKGKTLLHLRKLRKHEEQFDTGDFALKAQEIYINAHNILASKDLDALHDYVTEFCFADMVDGIKNKTIHWKWVETLELPRVAQIRVSPAVQEKNNFGQVTVRLHGRQTLAVYDRFGRLMFGHPDLVRNVLEYVVFEKHLVNPYGIWRIHSKIVPPWAPPRDPVIRTYRKPQLVAPTQEYLDKQKKKQEIPDDKDIEDTSSGEKSGETRLATS